MKTPTPYVPRHLYSQVEETLSCDETDAEPVVVKPDLTRKLICNISGGGGAALKARSAPPYCIVTHLAVL